MLSGGFALGVGLIATQNGFSRDLSSFLVGSILTVTTSDLTTTAVVLLAVLAITAGLSRQLVFGGFDPAGARAAGLHTELVDLTLLLTLELVIVVLVPAVGTILTLALIVAPTAAARLWSHRLTATTALAMLFGAASGITGLWLSDRYDVAAGAAITLNATAILLISTLLTRPFAVRRRIQPATPLGSHETAEAFR
jgi:ABC-type Mn2+/Zn2+ transport system permease subunit